MNIRSHKVRKLWETHMYLHDTYENKRPTTVNVNTVGLHRAIHFG